MFVVVEFNQASGRPRVAAGTVYGDRKYAEERAQYFRDELIASGSGRRERYAVWTCEPIDEED